MMSIIKSFKLFESDSQESITVAIQDCFADLLDEHGSEYSIEYDQELNSINVELNYDELQYGERLNNLDEFVKKLSSNADFFQDVKVAISRLMDEFPYLSISYYVNESSVYITIFTESSEVGEFYTKRGKTVFLDKEKLKSKLKLDPSVNMSIWTSERDIIRFDFANSKQFNKHMYRDFVDRRGELPTSFDNSQVEDALVIKPELMERYRKLGPIFSKLTVDGKSIFKKIERVEYSGNMESTYINGIEQRKPAYYFSVTLNPEFKYEF